MYSNCMSDFVLTAIILFGYSNLLHLVDEGIKSCTFADISLFLFVDIPNMMQEGRIAALYESKISGPQD